MLALSIALGIIILFAIHMAIKVNTREKPDIENEKLTQDAQAHGPPGENGTTAIVNETGILDVIIILPVNFDTSSKENVNNNKGSKSITNRIDTAILENATIAKNEEKIVLDVNKPNALEVSKDIIIDESNRGTTTGSLLYWHFVIFTFITFR